MVLLDTCTLLWLVSNRDALSPTATRAIAGASQVFVSAVSAFEIGTKHRRGKLELARSPREWWNEAIGRLLLVELAITPLVALLSTELPTALVVGARTVEHRDPGDRFIVATAAAHDLIIVTPDPLMAAYPDVSVLW